MRTRSGKVYDLVEPNTNMDPNASSSGITSPTDYMTLEILKALEKIKAQMNTLGQQWIGWKWNVMMALVMKSVNLTIGTIVERRE